jgi:hypothetical protein
MGPYPILKKKIFFVIKCQISANFPAGTIIPNLTPEPRSSVS